MSTPPRLLILGAHPDDAEFHAGGFAARFRRRGGEVKMVSVTDGGAGHQSMPTEELRKIRREEAARSAATIGAESAVWSFADGCLLPSLEVRAAIIAEIRRYRPDLVLTHRTCDYHPDHRAVGQAVQDASYMVTVPKIVPDVPALARDPVVAYLPDMFTRPAPIRADIIIDIAAELDTIVAMLACHRSQFFDWLPHNHGIADQVPVDEAARVAWLRQWYASVVRPRADRYRSEVAAIFGAGSAGLAEAAMAEAASIEFIEMFEVSEYARPLDEQLRTRLFGGR
ncbi:MAG: PIG-L family deacetylase [Pirellulales bacterium]